MKTTKELQNEIDNLCGKKHPLSFLSGQYPAYYTDESITRAYWLLRESDNDEVEQQCERDYATYMEQAEENEYELKFSGMMDILKGV